MYAILEIGGKQYKISEGEAFKTELVKNAKEGEQIVIDKVLAVKNDKDLKIGSPYLEGAKVTATLVENGRYKKVITVKFRRRKGYRRVKNHRQWYSLLKVEKIEA
ncbi:MAG: 50S ribosomal protein L21 [Mesoaciditoga sp.]|uniref:50S ribosomal protein L21 n=1 Tax=Athalassotoga sp. TaxID=2022597 RepID=UPI000CC11601|nr:MAG: 50S ribosomal protein L21 [Mesoaciditoga sp.]PMP80694.1 MAG: 50S ribosomal protein L21 [Mesoaciditoga sp.]HEU24571.1 50S ribosomal protein L21 [Mesoaciditoga lauensis]